MASYRPTFENFYSDKGGFYSTIGAIMPVLVNSYTDSSNTVTGGNPDHYAHRGFLYCDGSEYFIRDYPLLYRVVGNNYVKSADKVNNNSHFFQSAGEDGSIYRTFVDNGNLYAEIYKYDYTFDNANVVKYRSTPNGATLRFVGSLGSFPDGGLFSADVDYLLEYSDAYQNLAQDSNTTVHRFIVDGATISTPVVWSVNMPDLVLNFDGDLVLPIQYFGTVPEYEQDPETGQYSSSQTGYDSYVLDGALNTSPAVSWGSPSGLPDGVVVDEYEIYLENLSLENFVCWHLSNIPATTTFLVPNAEPPNGSTVQTNDANSVLQNADGTKPWIRSNGYSGPQPEKGDTNIYKMNIIAYLSNGQTLVVSKEFIAGDGPIVPVYLTGSAYTDNLIVGGSGSSISGSDFNILWSNLATHPSVRIRKAFSLSDSPYQLGKFRVPDYRDRKLIGYGEGVEGTGTPLVEDRISIKVGDIGGKWFIPTSAIKDPLEFFSISDVSTTGYSNVQTQIQAYLTGSKKYVVGPIDDYIFSKPPSHQHQLLTSRLNESNEVSLAGVDTFAIQYLESKGTILEFTPGGEFTDDSPFGHSHGLLGSKPINKVMATYGNIDGIGVKYEDAQNPGCYTYGVTESPPLLTTSVSSDGTYITVVTSNSHGLSPNDWVTITNAGSLNGSYKIIATGITSTSFNLQPDPAPAVTTENSAVVKQASGIFEEVTSTPDPDCWVVNSNTVIGGKETIAIPAGNYKISYDDELTSSGNLLKTAADGGANVLRYRIDMYAPGGGGAGTSGNGGNAGTASVTFTVSGVQYTVTASGGSGGTAGTSGGAGGSGGTVSIPTALVSEPKVDISSTTENKNGTTGGQSNSAQPPGGLLNGGPDALAGNGGKGGYTTSLVTGSLSKTFTSNGSYDSTTDGDLPTIGGNTATVDSVSIDISGGAGGDGNSTTAAGCTTTGGSGAKGRRVTGTTTLIKSFNFEIGTKGGDGFNNESGNVQEVTNTSVGTGAANGGNGGKGSWANGATGGAGGGATAVSGTVGYILGAGGGGGAGGSGGNASQGDGCSYGNNGKGPEGGIVGTTSIGPYTGGAGGSTGCTGGGGGGGGGGFYIAGQGGGAGTADGGAAGVAHPTYGTTGGGGGGYSGYSAYNSNYFSTATESDGSSGNGYAKFTVNYSGTQINPSGGGGGGGAAATIIISGTLDDLGQFATAISATLGTPGSAGSGNGSSGSNGYIRVRAYYIEQEDAQVVDISTPGGRVWETAGFPTNKPSGSGAAVGGAIWHSSSTGVNVKQASTGTFPVATTLTGGISDRYIEFAGSGSRYLQLGPLNLSAAEQLVFTVIKGNGTNGGDAPEEPLDLYYKTSVDSPTETLLQSIATATVTASGYADYTIDVDDSSPIKFNGVYLVIRQTRGSTSGDNSAVNEAQLDNWGLGMFSVVYGEVTQTVFTPSLNSSIPGNEGTCGPDSGIDVVRRTVPANKTNITFTDGTFQLSTSTPISITSSAYVVDTIPLITKYHRSKYLIKAF